MNKILFIIQPHSIVDVITNSSSELFVFNGKEKQAIIDSIKEIDPNYLSEYEELKTISELNKEDLWSYLYHVWNINSPTQLSKQFNIDLNMLYSNLNFKYDFDFLDNITDSGWKLLIQKIYERLSGEVYLLFSIRSNPNFEVQEELECIAHRYHLG